MSTYPPQDPLIKRKNFEEYLNRLYVLLDHVQKDATMHSDNVKKLQEGIKTHSAEIMAVKEANRTHSATIKTLHKVYETQSATIRTLQEVIKVEATKIQTLEASIYDLKNVNAKLVAECRAAAKEVAERILTGDITQPETSVLPPPRHLPPS